MSTEKAFTTRDYPSHFTAVSLTVKLVILLFLMELECEVFNDVSSTRISDFLATVEVLMERTFFCL